jgi:hypothetical protein
MPAGSPANQRRVRVAPSRLALIAAAIGIVLAVVLWFAQGDRSLDRTLGTSGAGEAPRIPGVSGTRGTSLPGPSPDDAAEPGRRPAPRVDARRTSAAPPISAGALPAQGAPIPLLIEESERRRDAVLAGIPPPDPGLTPTPASGPAEEVTPLAQTTPGRRGVALPQGSQRSDWLQAILVGAGICAFGTARSRPNCSNVLPVCHRGTDGVLRTLQINVCEVREHLAHGDVAGQCSSAVSPSR